ncbi:MAG: hypothetical protein EOM25_05245 [Deltaproteobacteria bacterium]|nr:hypothetical protein [Deltaproteobacteria bacterium]
MGRRRAMRTDPQDGAILLFVLLVLAMLVPVAILSTRTVQVDLSGSSRLRNGVQAESLALSGIRMVHWALARDLEKDTERAVFVDHVGEDWASFFDSEGRGAGGFETGEVAGRIVDEQSRFPINRLLDGNGTVRPEYEQTLRNLLEGPLFELEPEAAGELIASIADWMDDDSDLRSENSAEEEQYREAGVMCGPRNAPFMSLDELRLVYGMTDDVFNGRDGMPGLKDLVTTAIFDMVNINSADIFVLQAMARDIPQDTALEVARAMVAFRVDPWHHDFLDRGDWYREVAVDGAGFVSFPLGGTSTSLFRAEVEGRVGGVSRRALGLFSRANRYGEDVSDADVVELDRLELQ